jgi:cation:H+ antiporter
MAEALGLFALGVLALALGGDSVVKGVSGLAQRLGMRPFVAGLLLLAFGTSIPELAVNLRAMWQQQAHLALGNAVGSNVVNLGLGLGLAALAAPLVLRARKRREEQRQNQAYERNPPHRSPSPNPQWPRLRVSPE